MNKLTEKELNKLINFILRYRPNPPAITVPHWWIEQETAEHPERFGISNDEDRTMTWCGYIVYTYGDRYEIN